MLPSPSLPPITEPCQLVVEGKEDQRFFEALIVHLHISQIQVLPIGGKTKLRPNLSSLVSNSDFISQVNSIGIVRDADKNPKGAFQSVCSALKAVNLSVPKHPLTAMGQKPRVSVMILPSIDSSGSLEDICLKAVEAQPSMLCVEEYFNCIKQNDLPMPADVSKARIQVYLSSIEAELRLGEAAGKGFWDWSHPAFDPLKQFLNLITTPSES